MKPIVTIYSADNGYLVEYGDQTAVFQEGDTTREECEAAQGLLYAVLEGIGMLGSKHDPCRVRVVIEENQG